MIKEALIIFVLFISGLVLISGCAVEEIPETIEEIVSEQDEVAEDISYLQEDFEEFLEDAEEDNIEVPDDFIIQLNSLLDRAVNEFEQDNFVEASRLINQAEKLLEDAYHAAQEQEDEEDDDAEVDDDDSNLFNTEFQKRIDAGMGIVSCPTVPNREFPSSYYTGLLTDTHFHMPALPDEPPGGIPAPPDDPVPLLGRNVRIGDIECTLKLEGTTKVFAFFPVFQTVSKQFLKVVQRTMQQYPTRFVPFIQPPDAPHPMVRAQILKEMLLVYPGLFKGLGEIGFYGEFGDIADPPPDSQIYLENYKLAQDHNLMVMYHLGKGHKENFERVLQQHPDINFIFHGDTFSESGGNVIEIITDIFRDNPNAFYTVDELYGDVWILTEDVTKKEFLEHFEEFEPLLEIDLATWKEAIEAHPDQFMWGTDRGGAAVWTLDEEVGQTLSDYARAFIGKLDPSVQEKFAYKNAERLIKTSGKNII